MTNETATNNEKAKPIIESFKRLLRDLPDSGNNMHIALEFLSVALRFKDTIPPTAEFVTVLKHQKPVLYQHLRKNIASNSPLSFVLQLDMDYELALQRLELDKEA